MERPSRPTPLWGSETTKAVENFPISGEPIPARVVQWLASIKSAAARTNVELGVLDADLGAAIVRAADEIIGGGLTDQFPVDVFQTGSGTSSNMNVNEVISALTDSRAHPNDHVNLGQSSNDVFPTAVHLAALDAITSELLPSLERLASALSERATAFSDVVKAGRTHLMDAVPITLGQEFGGYASQVGTAGEAVRATLPALGRIPLGGTAVGNGLNTHPDFAPGVRERLAAELTPGVGALVQAPDDHFAAQAARDALVGTSGSLKVVAVALTKICNDLRWMSSGPRAGLGEIRLPELQKGSSIMPGKVNPVIPEAVLQVCAQVIGNDTTVTVAGLQGNFELNVMIPVMARNLLSSIDLLSAGTTLLAERCVAGIEANEERCRTLAELTLATATALNPVIGYDAATAIVRDAAESGRPLREVAREHGVPETVLDDALDLHRLAAGGAAE
jgi:fumarate hydratase class II